MPYRMKLCLNFTCLHMPCCSNAFHSSIALGKYPFSSPKIAFKSATGKAFKKLIVKINMRHIKKCALLAGLSLLPGNCALSHGVKLILAHENIAFSSPKTELKPRPGESSDFHAIKMNRYQKSTLRVPQLTDAMQHSPLSTALCVSERGKGNIPQNIGFSSPKTTLKPFTTAISHYYFYSTTIAPCLQFITPQSPCLAAACRPGNL